MDSAIYSRGYLVEGWRSLGCNADAILAVRRGAKHDGLISTLDLYKEYWCRRFALHAAKLSPLSRDELYEFAVAMYRNASLLRPEEIAEYSLAQLALAVRQVIKAAKRPSQPRTTFAAGAIRFPTAERRVSGLRRTAAMVKGLMTYVDQSGVRQEIPRGRCSLIMVGDVIVIRWGEAPECSATFHAKEVQITCTAGILDRRHRAR